MSVLGCTACARQPWLAPCGKCRGVDMICTEEKPCCECCDKVNDCGDCQCQECTARGEES